MNNYFSHDSNARNSDKLIPLRMKYGTEGYGIYFMILERLREEPEYMSVTNYDMIAFDLRADSSKVKSVVEDFGLFVFTEDGNYFYSESFNRRMQPLENMRAQRSQAGKKSAEKRANLKANEQPFNENSTVVERNLTNINKDNIINIKESSVKEKIPLKEEIGIANSDKPNIAAPATLEERRDKFYDDLIPFVEIFGKDLVRKFFNYWTEHNPKGRKMLFEMKQTFDIKRRLHTFQANEFKFWKKAPG